MEIITKTVKVNGTSYALQVYEIESKNYEYVTFVTKMYSLL